VSKIYYSKTGKDILNNASSITTPSFDLWTALGKDHNIQLLPHGIEDIWFSGKKKNIDPGRYRLVTVARLLKMKNIQIVLEAIAGLIKDGFRITYDIIGGGDYYESLVNITNRLNLTDFVRFHGYRNQQYIRDIYNNVDIYVMLSYPETFGLSFFEAAASGLYIIGAKNTGAYGHLNDSEATFIDPDEKQLMNAIKKIDKHEFDNKTFRMREKINEFENDRILRRYFEILKGAI